MQLAADAAALAAAALQDDDSTRVNFARNYFSSTFDSPSNSATSVAATVVDDVVVVTANAAMPNVLMRLFGSAVTQIEVEAQATRGGRGIELMLVLDVSGSMEGGGKIDALRAEALNLLEIVFQNSETRPNTWVGVTPFSGRVNIAPYGASWMSGAPTGSPARLCTGLRSASNEENDEPPSVESFPYYTGDPSACPQPPALGLTESKSSARAAIEGLFAGHGTSTNKGIAWGWRMLSPKWRGMWGDADLPLDADKSPGKVVILMTDGQNHPNQSGDPYTTAEADAQLLRECHAMKSEGITIYTVAFDMGNTLTSLYQSCATTPTHHFDADDSAALGQAFEDIGQKLVKSNLRLVQ